MCEHGWFLQRKKFGSTKGWKLTKKLVTQFIGESFGYLQAFKKLELN